MRQHNTRSTPLPYRALWNAYPVARGWTPTDADRTYHLAPFRAGDTANLSRMSAPVERLTPGGRAATVRFSFADDLDDPSLTFLSWSPDGYVPPHASLVPPPVDAAVTVSPPSLPLSGSFETPREAARDRPLRPSSLSRCLRGRAQNDV
jgi:hypothetical protein